MAATFSDQTATLTHRVSLVDLVEVPVSVGRGRRRGAVAAERGLLLSPLALLAACGGGGGGGGGNPPPPQGPTITGRADAVAITAGAAPVTGNVLANDTTTSGTLAVSAVGVQGGSAGTVGQAMQGGLGALTVNADGSYSFTVADNAAVKALAAGQTGTSTFTYTPSVGATAGTPQTVTVTVTGVNDAPTAVEDAATITEGATAPITGNVIANDTDPDGKATIYVSGVAGDHKAVGQTVEGVYGTLVINKDGSYSYTLNNNDPDTQALNEGEIGYDPFTYSIRDDQAELSAATLLIKVQGAGTGGGQPGVIGGTTMNISHAPSIGGIGAGSSFTGYSIDGGNVTGDGRSEIVVGAPAYSDGVTTNHKGAIAVLKYEEGQLKVVQIHVGPADQSWFGWSVSVGDMNGDGYDDIMAGAVGSKGGTGSTFAGSAYVMFGGSTIAAPGSLNGLNGFVVNGPADDGTGGHHSSVFSDGADSGSNLGSAVAILGDINGDGRPDFFANAAGYEESPSYTDSGRAYVGYGKASYAGSYDAADFGGNGNGFSVRAGLTPETQGFSVADSADVNGDGKPDLILGSKWHDYIGNNSVREGSVTIMFNPVTPSTSETSFAGLTGTNGVRFYTSEGNTNFGTSASAGDINGDGLADTIIGAPKANADGSAGKVYVVLGRTSYPTGSIDVENPPAGVTILEITVKGGYSGFGGSVDFIGDFNGDGYGDFAIGYPSSGGADSRAYILLGGANVNNASYTIEDDKLGSHVIRLTGDGSTIGGTVAGVGDVNGDGLADLAVSRTDGLNTGGLFLVLGKKGFVESTSTQQSASVEATSISDDNGHPLSAWSSPSHDDWAAAVSNIA